MKTFVLFSCLFMTACTITPNGEPTQQEQWNLVENKPGTVTHTVKARNGDTSEFAIIFDLETNLNTIITTSRSEAAEFCENAARMRPAQLQWLQECDSALAEPDLGTENRLITQFNKALILRNLGKLPEAKNMLSQLAVENPEFSEADYALAALEYDAGDYNTAITSAEKAIQKGFKRGGRAYYIIGKSHEYEFEFKQARRAYETGLEQYSGALNLRHSLERLNRLWPE